ncbi:MAG: glycerol-3-phosphate 1-O-acyltransferase PlsY [Ignavibacteriaceae bacterium]|nr:glycerol-3-phosphate 1-O-acyltransferase PlsY [Ignavibacteriaceae bacterium]
MIYLAAVLLFSYLIGSIPFAIIISKMVKGIDIKQHGSGNAGGTNVFRVLGWKWGILTIILDALKGVIAVVFISQLYLLDPVAINNPTSLEDMTIIRILAGVFAVIGHVWSIFASFKGGKGIATALGMMLSITTVDMLIAIGVFIIVVSVSKYVSLGSILAAFAVALTLFIRQNVFHAEIQGYGTILPFVLAIIALIVYTHRENIKRILSGSESKISFKKKNK